MDKVMQAIYELIVSLTTDSSSPLYYNTATPSATPHGIRAVYFGDPAEIGRSSFPAIAIRPVSSEWTKGQSRFDQKTHMVEVIIIENLTNYRETNPKDPFKVQSLAQMLTMMESTDNSQSTSAHSIIGKIRQTQLLPYLVPTIAAGSANASVQVNPKRVDYVFNVSRGFPSFEVIAMIEIITQGDRQ